MNPILSLLIASAFLTPGAESATPATDNANPYAAVICNPGTHAGRLMKSAAPQNADDRRTWKPRTAIHSTFNGIKWQQKGKYTFTYDEHGRTVAELQENLDKQDTGIIPFALWETTYDELGRAVAVNVSIGETTDNLSPYLRQTIKYDPVLTNVVIEQISETNVNGEWLFDDQTYRRKITRNENGDVTDMMASTWYNDDFLDVEALHTVYNNRTPVKIQTRFIGQTEEGDFVWTDGETYDKCEWYEYDGQLITLDDVAVGPNKIKSAVLTGADISDVAMNMTYDGENYVSTLEFRYQGLIPTKTVREYTELPNNGYRIHVDQQMFVGQWTGNPDEVFQQLEDMTETYDDYGNLLEAKSETFYGHAWINSWIKGEVTSDPEYGYPLKYVRSDFTPIESTTDGEWQDTYSIEYSDYYNPASVTAVQVDTDVTPVLYTIDGRKIDNIGAPGIYIRVTGGKSEKIIVK